jgi:hypothetical protein
VIGRDGPWDDAVSGARGVSRGWSLHPVDSLADRIMVDGRNWPSYSNIKHLVILYVPTLAILTEASFTAIHSAAIHTVMSDTTSNTVLTLLLRTRLVSNILAILTQNLTNQIGWDISSKSTILIHPPSSYMTSLLEVTVSQGYGISSRANFCLSLRRSLIGLSGTQGTLYLVSHLMKRYALAFDLFFVPVTWVGINDCAFVHSIWCSWFEIDPPELDRYGPDHEEDIRHLFEIQEELYKVGARNFLLIDVPPINRSPAR